jgi:hypothetical protein
VHLLEAEDADRSALLLGPWVIGPDADALKRVQVGHFVGDRVLGHRGKRAQDGDDSGGSPALDSQHVVDQGQGVTAAQLAHRPLLQRQSLDLDLEDATDPMLVGGVGPFRPRVLSRPGGEVLAEGVGTCREPVCLVDRFLGFTLEPEGPFAAVPAWLRDVALAVQAGVARHPDDLAGRVAAFDRSLAASHAASSLRSARKASTSAGSIRREASSL